MVEDAKEGCCDQAPTISESGKDAATIPRNGNPRIDLALPPELCQQCRAAPGMAVAESA